MTRLGYGDSQGKTGGNAVKEAIGDALRNAGMRFGIALELWHKGDLYEADVESGKVAVDNGPAAAAATSKPAAKPRGRAAAKPAENAPAETPAQEPQEPAGDDGPPMALGEPDPADPGHPLPPEGWEDRVASAPTLAALAALIGPVVWDPPVNAAPPAIRTTPSARAPNVPALRWAAGTVAADGASYREIMDVADWDRSIVTSTPSAVPTIVVSPRVAMPPGATYCHSGPS